jgi:hypothetical protein
VKVSLFTKLPSIVSFNIQWWLSDYIVLHIHLGFRLQKRDFPFCFLYAHSHQGRHLCFMLPNSSLCITKNKYLLRCPKFHTLDPRQLFNLVPSDRLWRIFETSTFWFKKIFLTNLVLLWAQLWNQSFSKDLWLLPAENIIQK